jgi:hypothetical protein
MTRSANPILFQSVHYQQKLEPSSSGHDLELQELGVAVSRRARNLIVPEPILNVERTKTQRDEDFSRHDLRLLSLVALDAVIDRMGFGTGATRRDIANALALIIRSAEPDIGQLREDAILTLVLDALLNEKERRQRFRARFAALENGKVGWHEFEYSLLEERQIDSGEDRVLRASREAINLYTSMLGLDLEDAAIADAAVLSYQAERGRLDDAIQTAHHAQIRAKAYAEHIRVRLEIARRDVEQAAWTSQVLPVIEEALQHIGNRIDRERELRNGLELRREQAKGEDLAKLSRLLKEIEKSERTNLDLHRLLLTANQQFRDEHARQRLRRPSAVSLPHLEADVFVPFLAWTSQHACSHLQTVISVVGGVKAPYIVSIESLWNKLLAPPIVPECLEAETDLPCTTPIDAPPAPFSAEDFVAVATFLRSQLQDSKRLSDLLMRSESSNLTYAQQRLFVLLTMQQFGTAEERQQFRVDSVGQCFANHGFSGDDLILSPP